MEDRIRELAYLKWEAAGCPPGDGVNFWCEAEAEINGNGCTEDHLHTAACGSNEVDRKKKVAAAAPAKIAAKTSKGTR